jgi:RND family efflux transporter MFP subunit
VTVANPTSEPVQSYGEYTGYLETKESVSIRARVRGFLTKVHFKEGTEVQAGDPLYTIDPREYVATLERTKAELKKAESEAGRAQTEEERSARLRDRGAVGEEEHQQKIAARDVARANVALAKANLEVAQLDVTFTRIAAPITGKVSRTLVTEGNLVGYNEPTLLTTINQLDPLYVYFDVPERNIIEYNRTAKEKGWPLAGDGKLKFELAVATEEGYPHQGVIDFRENRIDTGTGTVRMRGILTNEARNLAPGMYAKIRVLRGAPEPKLVIPEAALMADQRGRYVFVIKPDNTVEYRPVVVGTRIGTRAAIEKGLQAEDRVVINGLQKARPGAPVTPQTEAEAAAETKAKADADTAKK